MHIHILGICGTFMAGIAELAIQLGHQVTGSDSNVYPPMSTFLQQRGIEIYAGYDTNQFEPVPDLVLIGNALSRGNPAVEHTLNEHLEYSSGPQWLAEEVLKERHVIAISGTHGKTTTTSVLAVILDRCGLDPGYLIGGIPHDLKCPAHLGTGPYFVIEADEYDTAFFDKRSKFIHYRPDTLIINNLEFDHADIFADLEDIKRQFHHLIRTIPSNGIVIYPNADAAVTDVLERGCWSRRVSFGLHTSADCQIVDFNGPSAEKFSLRRRDHEVIAVQSSLLGVHNALNVTSAIMAAVCAGVPHRDAIKAVASFNGVKRRLEVVGIVNQITIYDDFAHHPTAIRATLEALRAKVGDARILCVLEPRSNTMRQGIHAPRIANALKPADVVHICSEDQLHWDPRSISDDYCGEYHFSTSIEEAISSIVSVARAGDHIVIMSNGGFANIHTRVLEKLG